MKTSNKHFLAFVISFLSITAYAQPPGGGRGPGGGRSFDPSEMVNREKDAVLKKVSDLSTDQTELIHGIYDEFGKTFTELRNEARKTRNFEEMRPKMLALREEKDALMKDLLNESQFTQYTALMNQIDKKRKERSQNRANRRTENDSNDMNITP